MILTVTLNMSIAETWSTLFDSSAEHGMHFPGSSREPVSAGSEHASRAVSVQAQVSLLLQPIGS